MSDPSRSERVVSGEAYNRITTSPRTRPYPLVASDVIVGQLAGLINEVLGDDDGLMHQERERASLSRRVEPDRRRNRGVCPSYTEPMPRRWQPYKSNCGRCRSGRPQDQAPSTPLAPIRLRCERLDGPFARRSSRLRMSGD